MMDGWKYIKLGDIIDIKHGYGFKGEYFVEEPNHNFLLTPGNFAIGGGYKSDKMKYYDGPINEEFVLSTGDVIVTMTDLSKQADTLGYSAKIPNDPENTYLHNQRLGLVSLKTNDFNIDYVYWLLRTQYYQKYIAGSSSGATVKHTSPKKIYSTKLLVPESKETQRKIATILSAYDDLIENNLKRIKLLEEKAQLTYEEWFVRLKFPGHETTTINKKTGLPEGWRKGKLSELIGYQSGFAYKSGKFTDKGFPVIKIKNIDNNTIDTSNTNFIDEEYALQTDKFRLNEGDLLIAMTGATVGKVGIVPIIKKPCYLNQRVGRFLKIGKVDNTSFINNFFSIGGGLNHVLNIAGGAAQPNISAKQILSIDSIIPPFEILERFSVIAINSTKVNLNLQKQNQLLKEARDILLPRLMTGMIDVEQINLETLQPTTA